MRCGCHIFGATVIFCVRLEGDSFMFRLVLIVAQISSIVLFCVLLTREAVFLGRDTLNIVYVGGGICLRREVVVVIRI